MATSPRIFEQINHEILIVIDTVTIKNKYYNIDTKEPIKIEKTNWLAIYQKKDGDNFSDAIYIDPEKNEKIIISGISIDGNSSDAIILNHIQNYKSRKKSIVSFEPICLAKKTISNNQNIADELSVLNTEQNFLWFESVISDLGKSKIKIQFSLYYLNSDGNQQDLYGSFWFPLEINLLSTND